jgi:UDP-N-acetylglucosamine transferase subunit ALG13
MSTFIIFGNLEKPFKRMADTVNALYPRLPKPVIIQAGANVAYFDPALEDLQVFSTCSYDHFSEYIAGAELVITHGGVGATKESILTGLRPAVFVRQYSKGEHIDDHQADWCDLLFADNLAVRCDGPDDLQSYLVSGQFKQIDFAAGERLFNCDALKADLHAYIHSVVGH